MLKKEERCIAYRSYIHVNHVLTNGFGDVPGLIFGSIALRNSLDCLVSYLKLKVPVNYSSVLINFIEA